METIILGNIINFFGVVGLMTGHYFVAHNKNIGFIISGIGALTVSIGSLILESYPLVVLDLLWFFISIMGYFNHKKNIKENILNKSYLYFLNFIILVMIICIAYFFDFETLGWITTFIYVFTYYLYSKKRITLAYYLILGILGFLILIPHLYIKMSYSVFFNEFIGAIISIIGLYKINKKIKY